MNCQKCRREISESVEVKITGATYHFCNKNCLWVWLGEKIGTIGNVQPKMTMPFGKYKGESVEDLPYDYIDWLLTNSDSIGPKLRQELQNQLDLKDGKGVKR